MKRTKKPRRKRVFMSIVFTLVPGERTFPACPNDFESRFIGRIKIAQCSLPERFPAGSVVTGLLNLPSCCEYFVYSTQRCYAEAAPKKRRGAPAQQQQQINMDFGAPLCAYKVKEELALSDIRCLVGEMLSDSAVGGIAAPKGVARGLIASLARTLRPETTIDTSRFQAMPFYADVCAAKCDMYRLPLVSLLGAYLVNSDKDAAQRKAIRALSPLQLRRMARKLKTIPWELVFSRDLHHGLGQERYRAALGDFGLPRDRVPPMIALGVRMYYYMAHQRARGGHTCFRRAEVERACVRPGDGPELVASAVAYLVHKGAREAADKAGHGLLVLAGDYENARAICDALDRVHSAHSRGARPKTRDSGIVPVVPPYRLTDDQWRFARYIERSPVTVLEGLPGTGKTAVVTWCMNRFSNVMLVSFIGMMVKSLQRRCGYRKEAAHTIHHVTTTARFVKDAGLWLREFDVLVIDEFSNVESSLLADLLRVLPSLCKLVVVGDHQQLFPIGPGDPMGAMIRAYGSLRLTEILRVQGEDCEATRGLLTAPMLVAAGLADQIRFERAFKGTEASLVLLKKPPLIAEQDGSSNGIGQNRAERALQPLFKHVRGLPGGDSVMNVHVVLVKNGGVDGRTVLNKACEAVFVRLGMLTPPAMTGGVTIRRGYKIYAGKKITFTQNYNKPVKTSAGPYTSPVANGELVVVKSVRRLGSGAGGGFLVQVSDGVGETKLVWISKNGEGGVDPVHVRDGFASTTYKTQGSEYEYVVFWMEDDPRGDFFSREHAYVAISRGKRRVWVLGEHRDFLTMCSKRARPRNTVLDAFLAPRDPATAPPPSPRSAGPRLALMAPDEPCVPTLSACTAARTNNNKKKRKKGAGARAAVVRGNVGAMPLGRAAASSPRKKKVARK